MCPLPCTHGEENNHLQRFHSPKSFILACILSTAMIQFRSGVLGGDLLPAGFPPWGRWMGQAVGREGSPSGRGGVLCWRDIAWMESPPYPLWDTVLPSPRKEWVDQTISRCPFTIGLSLYQPGPPCSLMKITLGTKLPNWRSRSLLEISSHSISFLGGSVVKNTRANVGDMGSIRGSGRSHGAAKPSYNNYWAQVPPILKPVRPRACALQQEKPPRWEAQAPQWRAALTATRENPSAATKTQHSLQ